MTPKEIRAMVSELKLASDDELNKAITVGYYATVERDDRRKKIQKEATTNVKSKNKNECVITEKQWNDYFQEDSVVEKNNLLKLIENRISEFVESTIGERGKNWNYWWYPDADLYSTAGTLESSVDKLYLTIMINRGYSYRYDEIMDIKIKDLWTKV